MTETKQQETTKFSPAGRGEILAWASYDIANATYATVVATAVYNAYFVKVVAGGIAGRGESFGTVLLTTIISISSILIVISAPLIGTICDATASKKRFLFVTTFICIFATAALYTVGPGDYIKGMILMIIASVAFGTGEDLIAAFLPELAHKDDMGRISALGWAAGYVGGLISLAGCLAYISYEKHLGMRPEQYVPMTMVWCATYFAIAVTPTFIWLKERAVPDPQTQQQNHFIVALHRLRTTISHARHYRDLFNFLLTLIVYSCGTTTIIHMASVYAQQVLGFTAQDSVLMIMVVNITAAIGAVIFGTIQDKIGSIKTLAITLCLWILAIVIAVLAQQAWHLWIAANVIGMAVGASGSVGRALVAQFSPPGRSGEFLGLWGMAVKLAQALGAVSFGAMTFFTHNNFRLALLSTIVFFVAGIALLFRVDEERGKRAATEEIT